MYKHTTPTLLIAVSTRSAAQAMVLPERREQTAILVPEGSLIKSNCSGNRNLATSKVASAAFLRLFRALAMALSETMLI